METEGLVYDIQGYSVHDGPGIRTTVFLKGCPLSCPWCHSPESQSFEPQVCFKETACTRAAGAQMKTSEALGNATSRHPEPECTHCLDLCPNGALSLPKETSGPSPSLPLRDRALCSDCGTCASACPPKAFYVCGKRWSVERILTRVLRDKAFYDASGGGVTLSGGEPLCQIDFSEAFLQACRNAGLHTALDTTGFAPAASVERIIPHTDLFLYDLKHLDSQAHRRATGVPNEQILDNARLIAHRGGKIQVRVPLIPRFNDSDENLNETAVFCEELGEALSLIQLLPYHTLGVSKHKRLQHGKPVFAASPMDDARAEELAEVFRQRGLPVSIH